MEPAPTRLTEADHSPTVSVVIPTYKHENHILETLQSVFSQSYADHEIIIVNDGSPDRTAELLAPLVKAGRIRYFEQPNAGQAAARNRGILEARGTFVALLDDDDLWPPDKLEWQVAELTTHPEAILAYGYVTTFGEPPILDHPPGDGPTGWVRGDFLRAGWIRSPGQTLIRTDVLREVGGFDTRIWGTDDWDLWLRLAARGQFHYVRRRALFYRQHPGNASKSVWRMYANARKAVRKNVGRFPHRGNWDDWFAARSFVRLFCGHDASIAVRDYLGEDRLLRALQMWLFATWLHSRFKMPRREFVHQMRSRLHTRRGRARAVGAPQRTDEIEPIGSREGTRPMPHAGQDAKQV